MNGCFCAGEIHFSPFQTTVSFLYLLKTHCTNNDSSIKDFFSKRDQIRSFLRIWSHLLKKTLMEKFIFCILTRKISRSVLFLQVIKMKNWPKTRSRCPEVTYRIGALKNFAKFTRKHLCQSLFFNKVAGLSKKATPFLQNTSGWLLLGKIKTYLSTRLSVKLQVSWSIFQINNRVFFYSSGIYEKCFIH